MQIKNANGHGVDIIAHNPSTGEVKVVEVKTTRFGRYPSLSADQSQGGELYTNSRLKAALKSPATRADALAAQEWLENSTSTNYEVQQVLLHQGDGGVVTAKLGINKPW